MPRESPSFHAMSVLMAGDAADSLEDRRENRENSSSYEKESWASFLDVVFY